MSSDFNSVDEFLSHRSVEPKKTFLVNWKKKGGPGYIDVWLHTKRIPAPVWVHSFPVKKTWTDKLTGDEVTAYFPEKFVCHESDKFLKEFHRDLAMGKNSVVPEKCPMCKLIHHVRTQIARGKLSWTDALFAVGEGRNEVVFHAGGIYNAFNRAKDDKEAQAELRKHGIFLKEAWKETLLAKCNYVIALVTEENPAVAVTLEASSLGDKIKECIATTMESMGTEDGNPFINPWCMRFKYNEDEPEFSKKYSVIRMVRTKLSPEVKELITGDPPSISAYTTPLNPAKMRLLLESACKVDLNFDAVFGSDGAEKVEHKSTSKVKVPSSVSKIKSEPMKGRQKKASVEEVACDDCGKAMLITDAKCKHCGAEYEVGEPIRPPQTKQIVTNEEDDDDIPF